jgi:hypothetical protein
VSGVPATTGTGCGSPSATRACSASGPSTVFVGNSSGSFAASRPAAAIRPSSYRTRLTSRVSVTQCSVAVAAVVAARPVSFSPSQSTGSRKIDAAP